MELICNELSFYPLAENEILAENRFKQLFKTFNKSREKYDFTHIRFPINYPALQITATQTFFEWISIINNHTLKNLILGLCKKPFLDDLEQNELNKFFEANYKIVNENAPVQESPIGLPISYIKFLPAISLNSHPFWQNRKIEVAKIDGVVENVTFSCYNICFEDDLNSIEMIEWVDKELLHCIASSRY